LLFVVGKQNYKKRDKNMKETWIETCKKNLTNLYGTCRKHDRNMKEHFFGITEISSL
jgi:hypothetical protein